MAESNSANDDPAMPSAEANNRTAKPYSKTFLLSADGKSAFAVQASWTDLGRQLSDFLLEPSRRLELVNLSRETFDSRRLAPQKFVYQLHLESQKRNHALSAHEVPILLNMLNDVRPTDTGTKFEDLQLVQEDKDMLRSGLLAKNLVLQWDGDTNILKWSECSMDRNLFQFERNGERLHPIEGSNAWNEVWPRCLRGFMGDRHQLRMAKLEKGLFCDAFSSTYAVSFRCASTMAFKHHFSLFWIVDGNLKSVLAPDHEKEQEPWQLIVVE